MKKKIRKRETHHVFLLVDRCGDGGLIASLLAHWNSDPIGNTSHATLDQWLRGFLICLAFIPGALVGSMITSFLG